MSISGGSVALMPHEDRHNLHRPLVIGTHIIGKQGLSYECRHGLLPRSPKNGAQQFFIIRDRQFFVMPQSTSHKPQQFFMYQFFFHTRSYLLRNAINCGSFHIIFITFITFPDK